MNDELSRRKLLGRAGLALGGVVTLGALQACGTEDEASPTECPPPNECPPASKVNDWPYKKHIVAFDGSYRLNVDAVKEAAYHGYYAGGCCHGAYSALLGHLAETVGAPFDELPLAFGKFGGGGVASYGSICGAALGATLILNMVVEDPTGAPAVRNPMIAELLRWYERAAFPQYNPTTVDTVETTTPPTKSFASDNLVNLQVIPGSHLCHASVTGWSAANGVDAVGADKKARCARLTADVAGKAAEMLNAYLAGETFTATGRDSTSNGCVGCHSTTTTTATQGNPAPAASGMACTSCHPPHF